MATAPALEGSSSFWHVRGNWSAREDRNAYLIWLGLLWVGMIAGFSVDFPRYLHEKPAAPWIVNVHAVVFSVWMLILTAQVLLVVGDRVGFHRKLGWFAAGWACLMAVMGPLAAMASQLVNLNTPNSDTSFISVNIVDIGGFLLLLAWGLTLRKNPAAHKRMMILATIALADPGFARFTGNLMRQPTSVVPWFFYIFYGNVLIIVLMLAWDWWRGRLMRPFVIGATALLAAMFAASLLYFWSPWHTLTLSWVQACAKL
jgi:hypothetical protein